MNKRLLDSPLFNASVAAALWALQIFAVKFGFNAGADALTFMFQSYFASMVFLAVYGIFAGTWGEIVKLSKKTFWILVSANAMFVVLGGLFFNFGAKLTSAINIAFLAKFSVVATILLAWAILKEKLDLSKSITVLMIIFGTFLLVTEGRFISPHIGDILILASSLVWSMTNVLIRKSIKNTVVPPDAVSVLRPISGLPIVFLLIYMAGTYPEPLRTFFNVDVLSPTHLLYAILNGFLLASLWIFINRTLKVASASYMTTMTSMTPVVVTVLAVPFLGETMSGIQIVGALIIVASGYAAHYLKFYQH